MKHLFNGKNIKRTLFSVLILSGLPFLASAEYNREGIPDSSEIRKSLEETWFRAPLTSVRMNRAELRTNRIGEKFQVRMEETDSTFNIFVSPFARMEVDVYTDSGKSTVFQEIYPGDAIGSWVLIRDKRTGDPLRIRYYFARNSDVYVQFYPEDKIALADFMMYNSYAGRGISTGIPFDRFYTASFSEIKKWTENKLPWHYTKIFSGDYDGIQQMIGVIREKLPELVFTPDASYDGEGNPVYISTGKPRPVSKDEEGKLTLSGAGFLKWICDGIIEPLTGGRLNHDPLTADTVHYKETGLYGINSNKYALSFTLDWTRNLATAVSSVRTNHHFTYEDSGVDVEIEPFSAELTDKGIKNVSGYIKDSGYSVKALRSLLYVLAATEPGTFYLASMRETSRHGKEIKAFNECAAIFPYFDSDRKFRIVVFQDCAEVNFESFCNRFYYDTVNLVKIQGTERFFPE